jgi:multidrug transporter EmrE-like cation transporter
MTWYDIVGNIGVFFIIFSYFLLQSEKIKSTDINYSIMNGGGSVLVLISLFYDYNLSAVVIQVFWIILSAYGIIKALSDRKKSAA